MKQRPHDRFLPPSNSIRRCLPFATSKWRQVAQLNLKREPHKNCPEPAAKAMPHAVLRPVNGTSE
jgi:hypothetical protein